MFVTPKPLSTSLAQSKQLQPMFMDLVTSLLCDSDNQRIEIITFEEGSLPTALAKQQMFMPITFSDECLASLRLVNTLDKMKFFKFFECAIDGDQAQCVILFARHVKDLNRGEGTCGFLNRLDNGTPRFSETVSVFLQLSKPSVSRHTRSVSF
jgi:hypothetical protein